MPGASCLCRVVDAGDRSNLAHYNHARHDNYGWFGLVSRSLIPRKQRQGEVVQAGALETLAASRSASCLPKCSKQPVAIRSTEGSVLSPAIQFDVAVLARNKRELDSGYERGNSYLQEQKTLHAQEVLQRSLKFQSGSLFGGRTAVALSNSLLYGTKRQIPMEPAAGKGACRQGGKESLKDPSRHSLQHRELASDGGRGEARVKGRT